MFGTRQSSFFRSRLGRPPSQAFSIPNNLVDGYDLTKLVQGFQTYNHNLFTVHRGIKVLTDAVYILLFLEKSERI